MVGEDWEAQFTGLAWERATLMAIVGDVVIQPTAVATSGNCGFWGIFIQDNNATVTPAFTVSGMSEVDWLLTGAFGAPATLVTATSAAPTQTQHVHVKAKRRITSRDSIYICAGFSADAGANPTGTFGGLLRFLIARA